MMLEKELKKLKLQSELVSIERICHDEELTGFLAFVRENICGMHLFTNQGEYDGFTLFETDQIEEVYWANREHQAIKNCIPKDFKFNAPKIASDDFLEAVIELGQLSESLCFHQHNEEDMFCIGQILDSDEEWFKLDTWGTKKTLSRMQKLLKTENLTRVVANSPYQLQIVSLHKSGL